MIKKIYTVLDCANIPLFLRGVASLIHHETVYNNKIVLVDRPVFTVGHIARQKFSTLVFLFFLYNIF